MQHILYLHPSNFIILLRRRQCICHLDRLHVAAFLIPMNTRASMIHEAFD